MTTAADVFAALGKPRRPHRVRAEAKAVEEGRRLAPNDPRPETDHWKEDPEE